MFELNTREKGLPMFFKGWQLKVLEYRGVSSHPVLTARRCGATYRIQWPIL